MPFDIAAVRRNFPALQGEAIFFDNPGGTQVPTRVLARMQEYLTRTNANRGGRFATSRASDEVLEQARAAVAGFLGARRPEEVVFGPNMTSLTFQISRALAREFLPGDEIIVTRLDHDANISPWLLMAEDRGCLVRWLDFNLADGTLDLEALDPLLGPRTRLVAVGYASNALGTINPVAEIARRAHAVGALCYVDAVQAAPHVAIDVAQLDCDFLAVSAYKFFGPHLGALVGRYELLEPAAGLQGSPRLRSTSGQVRDRDSAPREHRRHAGVPWSTWRISGLRRVRDPPGWPPRWRRSTPTKPSSHGFCSTGCESVPGLHLYGIADPDRIDQRVPTFGFTLANRSPAQVAEALGQVGIYVWEGNFYAPSVTEHLGVETGGGLVRVGLAHYNTAAEIDRLVQALQQIAQSPANAQTDI